MQVIPEELRQKWQRGIEAMDSRLGGTPEKPISSMLVVMESPEQMIAICSAGTYVCNTSVSLPELLEAQG